MQKENQYQQQDNLNQASNEEGREYFAKLYEEMTDPVKLAAKKVKEERTKRVKNNKEDYGI